MLLLACHTVQEPSAKVPFSMVALLDAVKKKQLPAELKCRQVFPTSGTRSTSLWDAPTQESLQNWLDEFLDADCNSEVFQVQEEFAYGISAELTRIRATERVTENTRATAAAVQERTRNAAADAQMRMGEIDAKLKVSEHAAAAYKSARESSQAAAKRTAEVFGKVGQQALENQRIAVAANVLNTNLSAGWNRLSSSFGFGAPQQAPTVPSAGSAGPSGFATNGAKETTTRAAPSPQPAEDSKDHHGGSLFTLDDLEEEEKKVAHSSK